MRVQNHISAPDRRLGGTEQGSLYRSADIPVCRLADFLVCFPKKRRQNSTSVSRIWCPTQRRHLAWDSERHLAVSPATRPEWNETERFRSKTERPIVPQSPPQSLLKLFKARKSFSLCAPENLPVKPSPRRTASSLDVKVSLRSQLSICVYLRKSAVKKLLLSFSFLFLFATQLKFKNPSILRKVPRR
jgi:hypothetical protein